MRSQSPPVQTSLAPLTLNQNSMIRRRLPTLSLILFLFFQFQALPLIAALTPNNYNNTTTHILHDVLKEISLRKNWSFDGIKTSKLVISKVRFGTAQKSEFRIRFGKTSLVCKFPDEVDSWNKLNKTANSTSDLADLVSEVGSTAVLDTFTIEGPLDLRVSGDDQLSISLPLNASRSGLKRILVGEGITLEVRAAQEVSLFHAVGHNLEVNGSVISNIWKTGFCPFWYSMCMPVLPIHVTGSASVIAYRTRNSAAKIDVNFLSKKIIELVPEKCYTGNSIKSQTHPMHSLSLRIAQLERLLKSIRHNKIHENRLSGFLRANLKASTIIRFQLELVRDIGSIRNHQGTLAEWRTRPTTERIWFDIMARVEGGKLKPHMIKNLKPFVAVDSASWSNLMSNISFTKFPSFLVSPEALTLDVKW